MKTMLYAKPSLTPVDLRVEHCMCCTNIKDFLTGRCGGTTMTLE